MMVRSNYHSLVGAKIARDDNYALAFWNKGSVGVNGQKFRITGFTAPDFLNKFTVEVRHRLDAFNGDFPGLWGVLFSPGAYLQGYYTNSNTVAFQWNAPLGNRSFSRSFILGQFNHFVFTFEKNVGLKLFVNGAKSEYTTAGDLAVNPIAETINEVAAFKSANIPNFNATGFARGFRIWTGHAATDAEAASLYNSSRKNIEPVPESMKPFLKRDFRLNQKHSRVVISEKGVNSSLHSNANAYTNAEVLEGGGAWVDVSALN